MVDGQFDIKVSFFEVMVALGYAIFADAPVDVAVVEVGLGGEWDATNLIDAEVAVVTPIDLDHTQYLGTTVESIAAEKAGIIKPGASADPGRTAPGRRARTDPAGRRGRGGRGARGPGVRRAGAPRSRVGGQTLILQGLGGVYDDIFLPLHGAHQAQNAVCALAAVEALFGIGAATGPLDVDTVREAFAAVRSPGRLEAVRSSPTILIDAAHNPHGMAATVGRDRRGVRLPPPRRGGRHARRQGRRRRPRPSSSRSSTRSSSRRTSAARALPADELAVVAVEIFGADRVHRRTPPGRGHRDRGANWQRRPATTCARVRAC